MLRNTHLTIDSERVILPGRSALVPSRTQIPIRPHRLRVEPEIASSFLIADVRVGTMSVFPRASAGVPATQFSIGLGDGLDGGIVLPGTDVIFHVENRGPDAVRFLATWASIVVPRDVAVQAFGDQLRGVLMATPGLEDLGTRISGVAEVARAPATARRDPPGFGWCPYGDD